MITTDQWRPKAPAGPAMNLPAREVFIHHTVTRPTSDPIADARTVDHISKQRFGRRTYSWLVHPDGTVIEYAGTTIGAHTLRHNSTAVAVSFIGNFEQDQPTPAALDAAAWLIESQTQAGVIAAGAPVRPHRDVYATACPGRHLIARIPDLSNPQEDPLMAAADDILAAIGEVRKNQAQQINDTAARLAIIERRTGAIAAAISKLGAITSGEAADPKAVAAEVRRELAEALGG